jgi:hypothetical protein
LQTYSIASPWLVVFDKYEGIIILSDPIMGDKYFIKTPQQLMGDIRIHYSMYGWLVIEEYVLENLVHLRDQFTPGNGFGGMEYTPIRLLNPLTQLWLCIDQGTA